MGGGQRAPLSLRFARRSFRPLTPPALLAPLLKRTHTKCARARSPPPGAAATPLEWSLDFESYAAEEECQLTAARREKVVLTAWGHGNETALINDAIVLPSALTEWPSVRFCCRR